MEKFFTAKQVIEILNIDRTTLYRMLKDGRLKGVKIGSNWRFDKLEVERITSGTPILADNLSKDFDNIIPFKCIVPIQDVIADIANIGVLLTSKNGEQLTKISNSCKFCQLIQSSNKGLEGCKHSWKKLAENYENQPKFTTCHAGLQYAKANIQNNETKYALLIVGQFTINNISNNIKSEQLKKLAENYNLAENDLIDSFNKINILDERWENKISDWLTKIAGTFEYVIKERMEFLNRFEKIVDISKLNIS